MGISFADLSLCGKHTSLKHWLINDSVGHECTELDTKIMMFRRIIKILFVRI